jgi:hypothetical protein|tara:strand:- start:560 stop:880 length:321 start_codon:yes stop_codon:yes gene_type:complete
MKKEHAIVAFAILLVGVVLINPALPSPSGAVATETTRFIETCDEGDGGFDLNTYSMVKVTKNSGLTSTVEDYCISNKFLREFSCTGNFLLEQTIRCANGCLNGACQ